jgi:LytS/YehU family sensor histidine kinase
MDTALMLSSGNLLLWLIAFYLPLAWIWAILTPVLGWWDQRIRERTSSLAIRIAAHLPTLLLVALVTALLRRTLLITLGWPLHTALATTLLYFADLTVASYIAALWAASALDAHARLIERTERAQSLESQLASAQMEYLHLQLRPHFLFNTLSSVAELGHEAPALAARVLRNVIALLESAIERHGPALVSLGDELSTLSHYIEIERLRFSDWLTIDQDIDEAARDALVPPFVLQPLVENAIRHGLVERTARGRITIRADVAADRLTISVIDNGVGLNRAANTETRGVGLRNVRERLDALYGTNASLALHELEGEGTAAELRLPMRFAAVEHSTNGNSKPATAPAEPANAGRENRIVRWAGNHPMATAVGIWTIVAMLRIQHSYVYMQYRDRFTPAAFRSSIRYDVTGAAVWLALTPLVLWLARKIPLHRNRLALRLAAHAILGSAISLFQVAITRVLTQSYDIALFSDASAEVYAWSVSVYGFLVILAHVREIDGWIRERDLQAARLRKQIVDAKFQSAMLELRPNALLDALRHLERTIGTDPVAAEKTLAGIGDFLRRTLDGMYHREVSVEDECAAVRSYAEVLSVATHPGLETHLTVPSSLLSRPVPNGVIRAALDSVLDGTTLPAVARIDVAEVKNSIDVSVRLSPVSENQSTHSDAALSGYVDQGLARIAQRSNDALVLSVG